MVYGVNLFIYCKLKLNINGKGLGNTKPPGYDDAWPACKGGRGKLNSSAKCEESVKRDRWDMGGNRENVIKCFLIMPCWD